MKRISVAKKCILMLVLSIFLILSLFMSSSVHVRAWPTFGYYHKEIKITSAFDLRPRTSIKEFLDSIRLVIPENSFVKFFHYSLTFCPDNRPPEPVTDFDAETGKYMLEATVELKDGNGYMNGTGGYFVQPSELKMTFNGVLVNFQVELGPEGEKKASGWWMLDCRDLYKVTFNPNGGTPTPKTQWVLMYDFAKEPKAPTKAGYQFAGWEFRFDGVSQGLWDFSTGVDTHLDLVARWKALPTKPTTKPTTTTTTTTTKPTVKPTPKPTPTTTTTTTTTTATPLEIVLTTSLPPETTITEPVPDTTTPTIDETLPDTTTMTTEEQTTTDPLIIGTETTPPFDRRMSGSKLPLYVGIAGGVLGLAAIGILLSLLVRKIKERS